MIHRKIRVNRMILAKVPFTDDCVGKLVRNVYTLQPRSVRCRIANNLTERLDLPEGRFVDRAKLICNNSMSIADNTAEILFILSVTTRNKGPGEDQKDMAQRVHKFSEPNVKEMAARSEGGRGKEGE